jgi:site-specific recombinase XerD
MPAMEATAMRVLDGAAMHSPTPIDEAYELFRLERQGNLVTPRTLEFYDLRIGEFIAWLRGDSPDVDRVDDIDVNHLRWFRVHSANRPRRDGRPLQPETLHASHRAIHTFFAWAEREGYSVDGPLLRLQAPRRPRKEATLFHLTQLRAILAACQRPEETAEEDLRADDPDRPSRAEAPPTAPRIVESSLVHPP